MRPRRTGCGWPISPMVHWFNTERTHEAIDDLTPVAVEQLHHRFRATLEQAG